MRKLHALLALAALPCATHVSAQSDPYLYWTLLPSEQMDEIIGEASGETAWNTILETGGYNRDRPAEEYADTFCEARIIHDRLVRYGLPGADLVRFPGGEVWDGVKGELWEVSPLRQKLASYRDMTAMLARGSRDADVTAELVWVGEGRDRDYEGLEFEGKIAVCRGSASGVHRRACLELGAEGVIAISTSREHLDPLQIPWSGISWRGSDEEAKFAFYLPAREGVFLQRRLLRGENIEVHAEVIATEQPYDLQDVVCHIPGRDPSAGEIILSAHLFEGYVKQGANDNKSGSAAILEVARTLHTLIEEGRLPRPRRTIRFLWGPEFSGTGPWVRANKDLMERTLCNINMDMVGEWLSKHRAHMCLIRTSYGQAHYVNDVMENYFRYVGETGRDRIHGGGLPYGVPRRIVAPSGADEPFHYSIEVHYGSSDHEVFNDWGVQVPGIMMIAWPDQWFHTSGDRVDKADPTQLKRVVTIAAAGAYTIANADDDMAIRIAAETAANASRRLSHQLMRGIQELNEATPETFAEARRLAHVYLSCALENEKDTLNAINELADDPQRITAYIDEMQDVLRSVTSGQESAIAHHASVVAARLGVDPSPPQPTELEQAAASLIPKQTATVTEGGYRGYRELIESVPVEEREKYPTSRGAIASTRELHLLIDGHRSALQIRDMLDAQNSRSSDLQSVVNYLRTLELAGLVEW